MLKLFFAWFLFLFSMSASAHENVVIYGKKPAGRKKTVAKRKTSKTSSLNRANGQRSTHKVASSRFRSNHKASFKSNKSSASKKQKAKRIVIEKDIDNFSKNKGSFKWPLEECTIKTGFGPYKVGDGPIIGYNPGLTLEATEGSCVQSVYDGIITDIFDMDGTWAVTIQHGNYLTVYSNLVTVSVLQNENIALGTVIGNAASNRDGYAEMEFILMKKNKNIDPEPWIRKN